MISLNLGYPGREAERELLFEPGAPQKRLDDLEPCLEAEELAVAQELADSMTLSPEVADYTLEIIEATRSHADVLLGASPRCAIALVALARARAWLDKRDYVLPDDIKVLLPSVLGHRLVLAGAASGKERAARALLDEILGQVAVPR
jgi:MoxR-like ATPase